jgi:hypothetical protein
MVALVGGDFFFARPVSSTVRSGPALRPVRAIMEKLNPKPEPQPLPAQGKRVEPSWRLARKRRR